MSRSGDPEPSRDSAAVRLAMLAEVPTLAGIAVDAGLFAEADRHFLRDLFAQAIRKEHIVLVAEDAGRAAGVVLARPEEATDRTWDLTLIAVHPGSRRRGVARALMTTVEDRLRERSQRLLLVRTSSTDAAAPARRLYSTLGYEEEARIRDRWADGDDDVTFRKRL